MLNHEIQRLRGIAILIIVVIHLCTQYPSLQFLCQGWGSVDLFFVVSGYVVTLSLLRRLSLHHGAWGKTYSHFLKHRALRLWPVAAFWSVIYLPLFWYSPEVVGVSSSRLWRELIYIWTFQYHRLLFYSKTTSCLFYFWSLSIEEQFYFFLPFLFLFLRKPKPLILTVVTLILIHMTGDSLLHWAKITPPRALGYVLDYRYRWSTLLCGVALALTQTYYPALFVRFTIGKRLISVGGPVLLLILFWYGYLSPYVWQHAVYLPIAFLSTALVWMAAQNTGRLFGSPGKTNWLEMLGLRAYSLYLSHITIMRFIWGTSARFHWPSTRLVQYCAYLILVSAITEASYRLLEKPFMRSLPGENDRRGVHNPPLHPISALN